ncbi:MAG: zf-HC2 domain-containing protein [Acidobacteria bacterium]|nr:zf-HC2 domain-containing protein [Acidobacteriota bacterium]
MTTESCGAILAELDFHLDGELAPERAAAVEAHLGSCPACAAEFAAKARLRDALRSATRAVKLDPRLAERIRAQSRRPPAASWTRGLMAIAATAIVLVGVGAMYRYYRQQTSPEGYIARWSRQVSAIVRVGLSDHLHCAVFGSVPRKPQPVSQMVQEMGDQYKDLLPLIKDRIPPAYQVMTAHRCTVGGRQYVHLAARDGVHIASLIITRKGADESFAGIAPVMMRSGIAIYGAGVDRFHIAAFETRGHLAYLISDDSTGDNMEMMAAFAPVLGEALRRLES